MALIDGLLEKLVAHGADRAVLTAGEPGAIVVNGQAQPGPNISEAQLLTCLREKAPPEVQGSSANEGSSQFHIDFQSTRFFVVVERRGSQLRASITREPTLITATPHDQARLASTSVPPPHRSVSETAFSSTPLSVAALCQEQTGDLSRPPQVQPITRDGVESAESTRALAPMDVRTIDYVLASCVCVSLVAVTGLLAWCMIILIPQQYDGWIYSGSTVAIFSILSGCNAFLKWSAAHRLSGHLYGGLLIRLLASTVDFAVTVLPIMLISPILEAAMPAGDDRDIMDFALHLAANWLYYAVMESSAWQATVGKRVCGLKVVDAEGQRISFVRATARWLSKALSIGTLGVGYLAIAFNEKRRALHDYVAGTYVMRLDSD